MPNPRNFRHSSASFFETPESIACVYNLVQHHRNGVWVYDTNPYQGEVFKWFVVGGTSVSAPSLAAILNAAGNSAPSSAEENQQIYKNLDNPFAFRDIVYGTCGINMGNFATPSWDFCTGVGTPSSYHGK
jgi:hypothetical protein